MMKSLLKQASLFILCSAVSIFPAYVAGAEGGGGFLNAGTSVSSTRGFAGTGWEKQDLIDAILDSKDSDLRGYSKWLDAELVKDSEAYRDIRDAISKGDSFLNGQGSGSVVSGMKSAISKAKSDFYDGLQGTTSTFTDLDTKQLASDIGEDIKTKAKDIVSGREAIRMINPEVMDRLDQKKEDKEDDDDMDVPTVDFTNITVGLFTLDSVFGVYHADEGIRDDNTRGCSIMGISPVTPASPYTQLVSRVAGAIPGIDRESPGFQCCVRWATENEAKMMQAAISALAGDGKEAARMASEAAMETAARLKECCSLSPEFCFGVHADKVECVNGKLNGGASLGDSMKQCAVECGKTGYGELKHMDIDIDNQTSIATGKYEPEQIDEIVKICENSKKSWAPSPTVLSADEMAPVLPTFIKGKLK